MNNQSVYQFIYLSIGLSVCIESGRKLPYFQGWAQIIQIINIYNILKCVSVPFAESSW